MDQETQNVAELFLFDFEISGVHLESSKRAKAVQLHEELLHLTNEFMQVKGKFCCDYVLSLVFFV